MYRICAIIGEAGSGKDTIMKKVLERCPLANEIISCTTRPRREGEVEGVNYFYLTGEAFGELVLQNKMLEATVFNDWFYGTSLSTLSPDAINVGVFNPAGIEAMLHNSEVDLEVYYAEASAKTRLLRQLNREENPDVYEIIRRFKADMADFEFLDFPHRAIKNETAADLELAISTIVDSLEHRGVLGQN